MKPFTKILFQRQDPDREVFKVKSKLARLEAALEKASVVEDCSGLEEDPSSKG
jgi:hypothetical protein